MHKVMYNETITPDDQEYIKELAMLQEVQTLQDNLTEIENELRQLGSVKQKPHTSLGVTTSPATIGGLDYHAVQLASPPVSPSKNTSPRKRSKKITQTKLGFKIAVKENEPCEPTPWTLTVTKGRFEISTFIKTHKDLQNQIQNIASTIQYQYLIPSTWNSHTTPSPVVPVLRKMVYKRYNKSFMINMTPSILLLTQRSDSSRESNTEINITLTTVEDTTRQLLYIYTQCQHLQHFCIHIPTFISMVSTTKTTDCLLINALCAMICSLRCKHILLVVPMEDLCSYGEYYFAKARDLLSDKFDQISLETLAAYCFLSFYKHKSSQLEDANRYCSIARRLSNLLESEFSASSDEDETKGQRIMYSRLCRFLEHITSLIEASYYTFKKAKHVSMESHKRYGTKGYTQSIPRTMVTIKLETTEGDTPEELRAIRMHNTVEDLQKEIMFSLNITQTYNLPHFIEFFGHRVEASIRKWYSKTLPAEDRLSMPLFDSYIRDEVYFATLERECQQSPIPCLTTLIAYREYLVLSQSYMPKVIYDVKLYVDKLKHWRETGGSGYTDERSNHKMNRWIHKMTYMQDYLGFDGTSEEYRNLIYDAMCPSALTLDFPIYHISIHTAINTVRLLQFLRTASFSCFFDIQLAINAFNILLRASKLNYQRPGDSLATIESIHANLIICFAMIQDEFYKWPHQSKNTEHMEKMEKEFREEISSVKPEKVYPTP
ncbi:hypothetical protein CLU79DRAFT_781419 [Phycomyces nitens]|nr:hypothetical protein CLU79DRAFT_781419 [Phycomyces nitens]